MAKRYASPCKYGQISIENKKWQFPYLISELSKNYNVYVYVYVFEGYKQNEIRFEQLTENRKSQNPRSPPIGTLR